MVSILACVLKLRVVIVLSRFQYDGELKRVSRRSIWITSAGCQIVISRNISGIQSEIIAYTSVCAVGNGINSVLAASHRFGEECGRSKVTARECVPIAVRLILAAIGVNVHGARRIARSKSNFIGDDCFHYLIVCASQSTFGRHINDSCVQDSRWIEGYRRTKNKVNDVTSLVQQFVTDSFFV